MKLQIALITLLFFLSIPTYAQVDIEHELSGLTITVKRCFKEGKTVFVDIMVKNTTRSDCSMTLWNPSAVDDEGVSYYGHRDSYWVVEPDSRSINCIVQAGIEKKYRMAIKNIDQYATKFQLIDIQCDWDGCGRFIYGMWQTKKIRIRDLSFSSSE